MDTVKTVGLIACGTSGIPDQVEFRNRLNGFELKKVHVMGTQLYKQALEQYPGAEIVPDSEAIIQDESIDLVIVSKPADEDFSLVTRALEAGKHVRIL
jgi:scyllo-inositol 2-dehydrogenase (NADP+)